LHHGADPNIVSKKKDTPLHYAVLNKNESVIRLLLIAGADMDIKGQSGYTSLEMAEKYKLPCLPIFFLTKGNYISIITICVYIFILYQRYQRLFAEHSVQCRRTT
jgi:hypothetical protein